MVSGAIGVARGWRADRSRWWGPPDRTADPPGDEHLDLASARRTCHDPAVRRLTTRAGTYCPTSINQHWPTWICTPATSMQRRAFLRAHQLVGQSAKAPATRPYTGNVNDA